MVDSWCHVWNIDLATGEMASHTTWNPGGANERHYGFTRLIDVDGDGKPDFVNLALTKHIDVLRNEGGRLVHAWTHAWPDTVTTEARSLRWPGEPVVDLDGDGRPEVVAALFDGQADRALAPDGLDAATGGRKGEALDVVPLGDLRLRGREGRVGLALRPEPLAPGRSRRNPTRSCRSGAASSRRSGRRPGPVPAGVQGHGQRRPGPGGDGRDVEGDGRPEFFTTGTRATDRPQAWGLDADGKVVAKPGRPQAPPARPLPPGIPNRQGTMVPYLLAADLDADGRNELLLYDNATITALKLDGGTLRVVESIPSTEIPVVADLLGDGTPCLLTAGRGAGRRPLGAGPHARQADALAVRLPGQRGVRAVQPAPPLPRRRPLHRAARGWTCSPTAPSPAARTYVLDGRTGTPVWEKTELPEIGRHFQAFGGRASAHDYDGDGADDVLFLNPDFYCIADGRTGGSWSGRWRSPGW